LPEVLAISDRIVTMREGRVTGSVPRREASEERLMQMMTIDAPTLTPPSAAQGVFQ
jgi:inositol transport system ATP-binding protein